MTRNVPRQVRRDGLVPRRDVHVLDPRERDEARVVDEHVDAAERVEGPVGQRLHVVLARDVGLDDERTPALLLDRARDVEHRVWVRALAVVPAEEAERDGGAFRGERERDRAADPAAGAGDQRRASGQRVHVSTRTDNGKRL